MKKKKEKKQILLVEDDPGNAELYQTILERIGKFQVELIRMGNDALERVKEIEQGKAKRPDLILLNLKLPGVNGQEILREIRSKEKTKDLNVFILSNYPWRTLKPLGFDIELLKKEVYLLKTDYTPSQFLKIVKERLGEIVGGQTRV